MYELVVYQKAKLSNTVFLFIIITISKKRALDNIMLD